MTTIVTRAYKDLDTAKSVMAALRAENHPDRDMDLFQKGDADLAEKMAAAKVPTEAVPAFVKAAESGKPVVVARAEITPFGAAARARSVCNAFNPVSVQGTDGDFYLSTVPLQSGKATTAGVPGSHDLVATTPESIRGMRGWTFSGAMGWSLLSDRRPRKDLVYSGGKYFSAGFMSLLSSRKPSEGTVYSGGKHFTSGYWPLLSERKPADGLVMKDHPHMSKRVWNAPLLSERR